MLVLQLNNQVISSTLWVPRSNSPAVPSATWVPDIMSFSPLWHRHFLQPPPPLLCQHLQPKYLYFFPQLSVPGHNPGKVLIEDCMCSTWKSPSAADLPQDICLCPYTWWLFPSSSVLLHMILYIQFTPKALPSHHSSSHTSCLEWGWEGKDQEEERLQLNGPWDTFMLQWEMVSSLLSPPPFLSPLTSICLLMILTSLTKVR